jgi:phytoene desaturase
MATRKAIVVGAGFGGLTSAALPAKLGFDVTVLEKNADVGGRARVWKEQGFTFDMGPSRYLMPEVFEGNAFALSARREVK